MRGSSDVETDPELAMDAAGGAQFKPLRALYDLGVSAKPDYLYDETKAHLLQMTDKQLDATAWPKRIRPDQSRLDTVLYFMGITDSDVEALDSDSTFQLAPP